MKIRTCEEAKWLTNLANKIYICDEVQEQFDLIERIDEKRAEVAKAMIQKERTRKDTI